MIREAPKPVNATLNTTAAFHCIATGELLVWFVDGRNEATPEAVARGVEVTSLRDTDGTINSTLTIPAIIDNDNITISCRAAGDNGIARSPEVLLRVQGIHVFQITECGAGLHFWFGDKQSPTLT